ncbi:magnesium transporter CorA family protein [Allofournierella sp.]|uniref:magnesium transporter CorA family protein n=1 Tax=Allofournierella sp. TaxID=1940256 RepID=UPI0015A87535|nr:magnesium transporter [Oscillospiraceae bacterium]
MITIYLSDGGRMLEQDQICPGAWIHLCDPSEKEIGRVCAQLHIDPDLVRAPLDEEERSRIEQEDDGQTLIIVDTPTVQTEGHSFVYSTIPFGIILTQDNVVTVCLRENALARAFMEGLVKGCSTKKFKRLALQMLYRNASLFLFYLRQVDKASTRVENELHISMKNKELIQMLGLEKSLVYFSTSLKGNEIVLEKLLRMDFVKDYPEDTDLLEDVIIENKQAMEMSSIYRDILSGTMDAFASVISNNLNIVMKLLAAVTIILTVPTIVSSLWGMNVPVPFEHNPFGFWIALGIAGLATFGAFLLARHKKWF